jgi:predicted NUDIX family NTP pyrophosphohydrolase
LDGMDPDQSFLSPRKKATSNCMRMSAGILLFKKNGDIPEFFLVHPGGPFWKGKNEGAWSIPKGEFTEDEEPLAAAIREFEEETGKKIKGKFIQLTPIKQKAGKLVHAWALEGDIDAESVVSNTFRQEWPYKSGKWQSFPEVDKASWFSEEEAKKMINPAQAIFIDELTTILKKND